MLLPLYGFAQLNQKERLEIPISSENESFDVIPVESEGLFLYRRVFFNKSDYLEIIKTDTAMHEQWQGSIEVGPSFILEKHTVNNGLVYLIFTSGTLTDLNFYIYRIDANTSDYKIFIVKNSIPFDPIQLETTSVGALIGGYFNRVPIVLFFDFTTQKSKILPGLFNEVGELSDLTTNPDETFDVLISARNYQRQQTLWVKNYDPSGKLLRNVMLVPEGDNHLIFGRTVRTNDNTQLIAGVYGNKKSDYSRGLFVANIGNDGIQQINYYGFGELENFFKYMRAKQEVRVKNRIKRKKIKGKRLKFHYRFIVHELVPYKNQFVLLGEAFYVRYKNASTNSYGYPSLSNEINRIFDGYQYTHAAVLGIGANGNLLWDNSFEINDVRTFTLEQYVKMDAKNDEIALLYLYQNKLRTKIIQDSTVVEGKSYKDLRLKNDENLSGEETESINKLEYWYHGNFMAYGVQNVISPKSARRKKKVFFVNKVAYN